MPKQPAGAARRAKPATPGSPGSPAKPASATTVQPNQRRSWPRHFKDRLTSPLPTRSMIWKILREGGFGGKGADKVAHLVPRGDGVLPKLRKGDVSVTWVGHATTLLRIGGRAILTDPIWSEKLPGPRSKRMTRPGLAWEDLPKIDAVVISHDHYDHLDAPTLLRLPRGTPLFVGANTAQWFAKRGFTHVTELDWWESAELGGAGGVRFTFVPAHHWCRRGVVDVCRRLWGSWVIEAAGKKVYFAGDTGYGPNFKEIGRRHGPFDVAILPIGAYDPRWFMQHVHTDPAEAVQACADLKAKRMVGMHWGTFVLTREPFLEPLEKWRDEWAKTGRPRAEMWDLGLGETRVC